MPRAFADALADRYVLERELGRGGMAVVWLARDLRHHRLVAVKALRPELSAAIGADRFRREIRVTAALQHPHILPLHDSGEAAGVLYYVMPYVPGETLRARLAREGALAAPEALRLAAEVGDALGHAHRHGVVHRDVKPENVLLADGHALVADFGIARDDSRERLTDTGLSIGTPAYMSPEQAAGDAVDARSDQYALAALTYELLAGEPPFTGPTAQAVVAKHVAQAAPSLRTTRPAIPAHVDAALQRALAKRPADRFATVADFVDALLHAPSAPTLAVSRVARVSGGRRILAAALGVLALVVVGSWLAGRARAPGAALDPGLVAVVPFRVDGTDPALAYLGEGMVDLIGAKLAGGVLRAVDARVTLSAWRQAADRVADPARTVAGRLGAGLVIDGSLVGSGANVTLSGALRDAASGANVSTGQVQGPADSMPLMVDRLLVTLLAGRSGVTVPRLAGLSSVPALREYLAGLAAHRAGRYDEAVTHFDAALREDSTFALAALAAVPAAWRRADGSRVEEIERRALRLRGRLQGADAVALRALVGDTSPDVRSILEVIGDLERAVAAAPDRADLWFELGDRQLHFGLLQDYPDALARARRSLTRALALDSSFAIAVDHLLLLALHDRDTALAARLAPVYRRTGSRGDAAGLFDWILAELSGDSAAVGAVRAAIPTMPAASLRWLGTLPQLETGAAEISALAAAQLERDASTVGEVRTAAAVSRTLALNSGHPREAERAAAQLEAAGAPRAYVDFVRAVAADYWDGDAAAGVAGRRRLAAAPADPRDDFGDGPGWSACAEGLHGIATGDPALVAAASARMRELARERTPDVRAQDRLLCAAVLRGAHAVSTRSPDARSLLLAADSLFLFSPVQVYWYYGLVVARLYESLGDTESALLALRRRAVASHSPAHASLLSALLREEGRLAELAGDTSGAIRAYRHHLALRADPDPSLLPQRDSVRAALGALLGEPRRDLVR